MKQPSEPTIKPEDARVRRSFNRVVTFSSASAMAGLGGFLGAVKQVNPALEVRLDLVAALAFLAAGAVTWLFCNIMLPSTDEVDQIDPARQQTRKRWLIGFSLFSGGGILAAVVASLRTINGGELRHIVTGVFFAVVVLAGVGWFAAVLFRFMEKEDASLKDGECEPGELDR